VLAPHAADAIPTATAATTTRRIECERALARSLAALCAALALDSDLK
jgi:hypothetical protein